MVGHKLGEFAPTRTFRGHTKHEISEGECRTWKLRAYLKYVRISPRKVQIVCDLIRGKDIKTAMAHPDADPQGCVRAPGQAA